MTRFRQSHWVSTGFGTDAFGFDKGALGFDRRALVSTGGFDMVSDRVIHRV